MQAASAPPTWWLSEMPAGLMTDLYHPDAAYVSWRTGQNAPATFDLYTRLAPFGGAYLLVAGLEPALAFVRAFRYSDDDLAFLASLGRYDPGFLDHLRRLRFTGEVLAMPEGTVAFPHEPLLRVTAPFQEAILLESGLMHLVGLSTLIATKTARVVHAARGRPVAEFGFRRAQAPFVVARSAAIGGCASTSFLVAARRLGLRPSGTIPHALVQLFDREEHAFRAVAESFDQYTLLLDTYDVRGAIHTAVAVARDVQARLGHTLAAVRLDSGDVLQDSIYVRGVLDDAGLNGVRVLASGDLDEFAITDLLDRGAPIDAFGVGTSIGIGAGSAERGLSGGALAAVYKEVWYEGGGPTAAAKVKAAGPKSTWPGRKQVYRVGAFAEDVIQLEAEPPPEQSAALLRPVIRDGVPLPGSTPPLPAIVEYARHNLQALPEPYHALSGGRPYPVRFSDRLQALRREALARHLPDAPGAPPQPVRHHGGAEAPR